ncbi:hypothetical protein LCGC14_0245460 [marine sediment metagenome]|uniref:Uncharacterized protein n=1 Tax=marine sediment metagenome TaxID=412755 RepID=A0A0F9U625_9ZZZZ
MKDLKFKTNTFLITNREFEIDFKKVKTINDIIVVLKGLNLKILWNQENCPDQFKDMYEKGFLTEVKK